MLPNASVPAGRVVAMKLAAEAALTPQPTPQAQAAPSAPFTPLTAREREVAVLIAEGLTNREIAARLVITRGTAAVHVGSILRKLDLATRIQVAAWVITHGEARGRR